MTTAADFNTTALYPGAQPVWDSVNSEWTEDADERIIGCKVGTDDRYPDALWSVNVDMDDLHKWMWNMEVWDMDLSLSWETQDDASPTPGTSGGSLDLTGQWHYLSHDSLADFAVAGRVLQGEPNERICGDYYQTSETLDFTPTTTHTTGKGEYLLPNITFSGLYDDLSSISFDIEDGDSNVVGDVSELTDGNTDHTLDLNFYYIRLRGNGTADLYFDLSYSGYSIEGAAGSELAIFANQTEADADSYWDGASGEAVDLTILGKTVSGYIKYRNFSAVSSDTLNSFSFTYGITVTTAYTY